MGYCNPSMQVGDSFWRSEPFAYIIIIVCTLQYCSTKIPPEGTDPGLRLAYFIRYPLAIRLSARCVATCVRTSARKRACTVIRDTRLQKYIRWLLQERVRSAQWPLAALLAALYSSPSDSHNRTICGRPRP